MLSVMYQKSMDLDGGELPWALQPPSVNGRALSGPGPGPAALPGVKHHPAQERQNCDQVPVWYQLQTADCEVPNLLSPVMR